MVELSSDPFRKIARFLSEHIACGDHERIAGQPPEGARPHRLVAGKPAPCLRFLPGEIHMREGAVRRFADVRAFSKVDTRKHVSSFNERTPETIKPSSLFGGQERHASQHQSQYEQKCVIVLKCVHGFSMFTQRESVGNG